MRAVTAFVICQGQVLILKRSMRMPTFPGRWSAVSGILEGDEDPQDRARTEICEETGMRLKMPICAISPIRVPVESEECVRTITIHPFLFATLNRAVQLNRENDAYAWVWPIEIDAYGTVPFLHHMLLSLLCAVGTLTWQHDIHTSPTTHSAGNTVTWMLSCTGVNTGSFFGIY